MSDQGILYKRSRIIRQTGGRRLVSLSMVIGDPLQQFFNPLFSFEVLRRFLGVELAAVCFHLCINQPVNLSKDFA